MANSRNVLRRIYSSVAWNIFIQRFYLNIHPMHLVVARGSSTTPATTSYDFDLSNYTSITPSNTVLTFNSGSNNFTASVTPTTSPSNPGDTMRFVCTNGLVKLSNSNNTYLRASGDYYELAFNANTKLWTFSAVVASTLMGTYVWDGVSWSFVPGTASGWVSTDAPTTDPANLEDFTTIANSSTLVTISSTTSSEMFSLLATGLTTVLLSDFVLFTISADAVKVPSRIASPGYLTNPSGHFATANLKKRWSPCPRGSSSTPPAPTASAPAPRPRSASPPRSGPRRSTSPALTRAVPTRPGSARWRWIRRCSTTRCPAPSTSPSPTKTPSTRCWPSMSPSTIRPTGVVVKLAGHVVPDPATGRLTTTFYENPHPPFGELKLDFFGGANATLRTPPTATPTRRPRSLPVVGHAGANPPRRLQIVSSPSGGNCPTTEANSRRPPFDAER